MAYVFMAYVVMAYTLMVHIVMAYTLMVHIVMAYIVMVYIGMAYITVMDYRNEKVRSFIVNMNHYSIISNELI